MAEELKRKSLKEKAKEFGAQLPLMEGKTKGEINELLGKEVTINDFGFLTGDNGDYVVFTIKEIENEFFFGGLVLTDAMKDMYTEGYYQEIVEDGLPMLLTERKSKNKRTYTAVEFYPESK